MPLNQDALHAAIAYNQRQLAKAQADGSQSKVTKIQDRISRLEAELNTQSLSE